MLLFVHNFTKRDSVAAYMGMICSKKDPHAFIYRKNLVLGKKLTAKSR